MSFKIICFFCVVGFFSQGLGRSIQEDLLEWVPYVPDDIPSDAILVGINLDNKRTYIGRVHLVNNTKEGYVPVDIVDGEECVYGLLDEEVVQVCDNISILIGKNTYLSDLFWNAARPTFFFSLFDSDEYHPVRVGWEVGNDNDIVFNSSLYLARSFFSGNQWNSKIYTSRPDQNKDNVGYFSYVNYYTREVEALSSYSYEVLLFKN